MIGTFTTDLSLGSKSVSAEVSVIKRQGEPLLGRESAVELGVLKLQVPLNYVARVDHSDLTTNEIQGYFYRNWKAERLSTETTH